MYFHINVPIREVIVEIKTLFVPSFLNSLVYYKDCHRKASHRRKTAFLKVDLRMSAHYQTRLVVAHYNVCVSFTTQHKLDMYCFLTIG